MRLLLALLAGWVAACGSAAPPSSSAHEEGPRQCVRNRTELFAQNVREQLDVLVVISNSPAMAPALPELQRRLPSLLEPLFDPHQRDPFVDLHVGVTTSDAGGRLQALGAAAPEGCRPPLGASYLRYRFRRDRPDDDNLPPGATLQSAFTCLASAGAAGSPRPQLLEAAYAAIRDPPAENAGFLRDEAFLVVLFLGNEDDASSPGEGGERYDVGRYVDFFRSSWLDGGARASPLDVVLLALDGPCRDDAAGLVAAPAPRLDAVVDACAQHVRRSFCDDRYQELLAMPHVVSDGFGSCIVDPLPRDPDHPDRILEACVVEERSVQRDGTVSVAALPRCEEQRGFPCWRLEPKPSCVPLSPDGLGFTVDRDGDDPPPRTTAFVTCASRCDP